MGIFSWIIMGLLAGILAKLIMPGDDSNSIIGTTVLGVIGALLGGFVATAVGLGEVSGFDLRSIAIAVAGAFIALFIYKKVKDA